MEIIEGALKFEFPATYQAAKYDDWAHYRNQFQNKCSQYNKAVDILAFEENQNCCWLCEVKDFRIIGRNPDKLPLEQEIAQKVRDTLAGIVSAKFCANNINEKDFAAALLTCRNIRVVIHIEQPQGQNQIYDLSDLKDKLNKLLKAIDPHVLVTTLKNHAKVSWTVTPNI